MTTWAIAKTTFGDAMRKKVLNIFLISAVGMIVLSLIFSSFEFRTDMSIVKSFGLGMIAIAGLFISLIMGIHLIPTEIERRTIYTILSKPVKRWEFVTGKFLGAAMTLFVNVLLIGAVFIAAVTVKAAVTKVPVKWDPETMQAVGTFDPSLVTGVFMIYFQFLILTSVAIFFSTFMTPMVNFFASGAVFIVGSVSSMFEGLAHREQAGVIVQWGAKIIQWVVPQFSNFNIQNPIIHPELEVKNMSLYVSYNIGYALFFCALLVVLSVFVFLRREV